MKTQTSLSWLVAVAGILAVASGSYAQNALGDGRKLDNNLQQGSGGVNSPQPDQRLQYSAYQDAIITGNVTGLSRFRGNIDYRAPGEFTGRLDRSSYNFELRSLPGAAINDYQRQQLGQVPGQYTSPYQHQAAIALRGGSGVTIADITGQGRQVGVPGSLMLRDDVTGLGVRNALDAPTLTSTVLSPTTSTVGLTVDPSGNVMRITASPLAGLRTVPAGDRLQTTLVPRPTTPGAGGEPKDDGTVPLVDPRVEGVPDPGDEPAPATDDAGAANPAPLLPTARIDDRQRTDRPGPINDRIAGGRIDQVGSRTGELVAGSANWRDTKPGEDVYFDILRRMDALRTANRDQVRPARPDAVVAQGTSPDREPGTEVNKLVERPKPAGADAEAPANGAAAAAREDQQVVDRLLAQVGGKNQQLDTLTGNGDTAFDHALADAETLMKAGEYFKAEEEYVKAMRLKPGHPMAMTGRIHAQIGAGLNLSAATNLRTLMERHPELIAVRYSGPLMPSEARMNQVLERLAQSIAESNRPDLPMLAAYLGYQTGNRDLVERGLKAADERRPNDRLISVLRQVWPQGKPLAPVVEPDAPQPKPDDGVDGPAPKLPTPPKGVKPLPSPSVEPEPAAEPAEPADPAVPDASK